MQLSKLLTTIFVSCLAPDAVRAQASVVGIDLRHGNLFTSDTADFVGDFSVLGPNALEVHALDFEPSTGELWGIEASTSDRGTFDLGTGAFQPQGTLSGIGEVTGLTATPEGVWYLIEIDQSAGGACKLYEGDITTGTFSLVGVPGAPYLIDIAADSVGQLYTHSIATDELYAIDSSDATLTPIGPTGQNANFAQGMDFDWSTDTLYGALYIGMGTGVFAEFDLVTGVATVLQATDILDGEFVVAIDSPQQALGTNYCTSSPNSSGAAALVSAIGSRVAADAMLTLRAQPVPNGVIGIFFYGRTQGALPFGNGTRCVLGFTQRMPPGMAQGSTLGRVVDFGSLYAAGIVPGPLNFQAWFRDQGDAFGFQLSDGLEIVFQ